MSVGFGMELSGIEENVEALDAIAAAIQSESPGSLQEAGFPLYFALANYPDQRPGSKYQRTFALRDSTFSLVEQSGSEVSFSVGQTDAAAHWVGHEDDDYQAQVHVGIWETIRSIKDRLLPVVFFKLDQAIDAIIKRYWR